MKRSWRFQISLILMSLFGAFGGLIAEYSYDASSAVINIFFTFLLLLAAGFSMIRPPKPLPWFINLFLNLIIFISILLMVWNLLFATHQSSIARAFSIAHITLLLSACRFIQSWRTRDFSQIFLFSLLLMVISAITCTSIILVPVFILYLMVSGYALILYQLQRQVEQVLATRFIGVEPSGEDLRQLPVTIRGYWSQLGQVRFTLTCGLILLMVLILAGAVFIGFPRLEAGSLLGGRFGTRIQSGFNDQISLGSIDKNDTLRQVVAHVIVSQDGKPTGSLDKIQYLRCAVLDQYTPYVKKAEDEEEDDSSNENLKAQWARSLLGFLVQNRLPDQPADTKDTSKVKMDVLLSNWQSPYMPTLYPVDFIEGIDKPMRLGQVDRVVSFHQWDPQAMSYQAYAPPEISPEAAWENYVKQLRRLGPYWITYATSLPSGFMVAGSFAAAADSSIADVAKTILAEDHEKRLQLEKEKNSAVREWQIYQQSKRKGQPFELWNLFQPTAEDPNDYLDSKELEFLNTAKPPAMDLGKLDRKLAARVVEYLHENHKYTILPQVPPAPPREALEEAASQAKHNKNTPPYVYDPVEIFVSKPGTAGNCEYFAGAMVQICRAMGLQARIVVGYLGQEYSSDYGYYIVRQCDAHSWVEVYTADQDWVVFDPTPPANLRQTVSETGFAKALSHMSHYFENLQLRWLKFNASDQGHETLKWANSVSRWMEHLESSTQKLSNSSLANAIRRWFTHQPEESYFSLLIRWIIFFGLMINLGIGLRELLAWIMPKYIRRRVRKRNLKIYNLETVLFYRQMLEILDDIHLYKPLHRTPREFALDVMEYDRAFEPVGKLSEIYYRVRYGDLDLDETRSQNVEEILTRLRVFTHSIRKTLKRPWPWEKEE